MPSFTYHKPDYVAEDKYLLINQCGMLQSSEKSANVLRHTGRKDYLMLYVLDGKCILNHTFANPTVVGKGNLIFFKPEEPQYYFFPKEDNSTQIYIHFTGTGCKDLFEKAAIKSQIIKPRYRNELEYYLQRICELFDYVDSSRNLECEGLLMACFGLMVNRPDINEEYHLQKYHRHISRIISQIQTEPHLMYSVEEWAKQCNLSTQQFINVFKASTGYSPYKYLMKTRISCAKELLLFTDCGMAEISNFCGFENQNYFARIFKKNVGLSPSEYKKSKQNNQIFNKNDAPG